MNRKSEIPPSQKVAYLGHKRKARPRLLAVLYVVYSTGLTDLYLGQSSKCPALTVLLGAIKCQIALTTKYFS